MAFRYGSWSQPGGYDTSIDLVGALKGGLDFGTGLRNEQDAKAALGDYVKSLYMGEQPTTAQPYAGAPDAGTRLVNGSVDAAINATDPTLDAYFGAIRAAESGGNDAAKNPNSSATGRYQFTSGTWNGLMQQHPELGLTAEGRTDPAQQERAIRAFTNDNIGVLRGKGISINPGNLYASHFLGAGGATNVLGQSDDTPMSAAVSSDVIEANPFLANMTVGQFKQWTAEKASNGHGGYRAPMVDAPSAPAQAAQSSNGLPPRDVMMALFRNPATREFAAALAQGVQAGTLKPTDDMREYAFAASQGFNGSFADWQKQNKAGVTVNTGEQGQRIGTIPPGMAAVQDPSNPSGFRMETIPGSPAAIEAEAADAKRDLRENQSTTTTGTIVDEAKKARGLIGPLTTGAGGWALGNLPFTSAAELQRHVASLKSIAAAENLNQMRQASPTGGALGNASDADIKLLQDKAGALDPASPNFPALLDDYEQTLLRIVHGPEAGDRIFEETRGGDLAEGTIIENDAGERMVLRNGQWEPM